MSCMYVRFRVTLLAKSCATFQSVRREPNLPRVLLGNLLKPALFVLEEDSRSSRRVTAMLALSTRSSVFVASSAHALRCSLRSFTLSASRFQAVPTEKPVLNKEFKIYRWVSSTYMLRLGSLADYETIQNPDEPDKQPTLQSYTIDLNQTGPMVRTSCSTCYSCLFTLLDPGRAHQN